MYILAWLKNYLVAGPAACSAKVLFRMLMDSSTDMLKDELDMAYKLVIQYTHH